MRLQILSSVHTVHSVRAFAPIHSMHSCSTIITELLLLTSSVGNYVSGGKMNKLDVILDGMIYYNFSYNKTLLFSSPTGSVTSFILIPAQNWEQE